MRTLLLILSSVVCLAQTTPRCVHPFSGGQTIYRGYNLYVGAQFFTLTSPVDFTVSNSGGDMLVTAPGHVFTSGSSTYRCTTGVLPQPMNNRFWEPYYVTSGSVSGSTFKLNGPAGVLDYVDAGTGTHTIGLYNGSSGTNLYFIGVNSLPSGVTATFMDTRGVTLSVSSAQSGTFAIKLTASSTAALGSVTASVRLKWGASGTEFGVDLPITVASVPATTFARPTSFPAIVGKQMWESQMIALGSRLCTNRAAPTETSDISPGGEGSSAVNAAKSTWYYDGGWVYHQVADYTGDETWRNCAYNYSEHMRDYVLARSPVGNVARGYYVFQNGLKRSYACCDPTYKTAHDSLASASPYAATQNALIHPDYLRESSLMLEAELGYARTTGAERLTANGNGLRRMADILMGILDAYFVQTNTEYVLQPFMAGMAMRSLIVYWERTGDPRVPYVVKQALDWLWTNSWVGGTTKTFYYNPFTYGRQCQNGCRVTYEQWPLNHLIVPAYGWYWYQTGVATYRTRGDEIFNNVTWTVTYTVATGSPGVFTLPGHSLSNGDTFQIYTPCVYNITGCTATLPGGLVTNNSYIVRNVSGDTFTLETTGGSQVNISSTGSGVLGGKIAVLYNTQGMTTRGADMFFTGKIYSQNYRWSIDYVRWREGKLPYRP